MDNFLIAQLFGVMGIIFSVLSMQMKTKKNIMLMLLALNLASALNFLFLGSVSGSLISFFAVLETVINYLFDRKDKRVPIYIIGIYVIVNIALGLISYKVLIDVVPIICALLFCASICTRKESNIRKIMFLNQISWFVYDINSKAYMFAISNVLTMISIIISIVRYDLKKQK